MHPALREFLKVMCVVALMVGAIGAAVAWSEERPTSTVWSLRIVFVLVCLGALIGFLAIHFKLILFRPDLAPDFLREFFGAYFDRGGFCFSFAMSAEARSCILWIFYQNRHENPCYARVAIRPAAGFLGGRKLDPLVFDIHANCAAFGVARAVIPMPRTYQGRTQSFEIGASVDYPSGKGPTLRFGDGIPVRTNADFTSVRRTMTTAALLAGGIFIHYRPASVTLKVPIGISDDLPTDSEIAVETLWTIGDSGLPSSTSVEVKHRISQLIRPLYGSEA
jgi:hypothetical protein